jgi:UDP-N-acetylmuramoylalanine--D-glutamate ligase
MPTRQPTIDLDGLTLDAVRAGALHGRPVTVLGLARSGIGLVRFFRDAGAAVTAYDVRPAGELADALAELGDAGHPREMRLLAGAEVDPAVALAGAHLVATSPSISPDYPTTEPRLRAALRSLVAAREAGDPSAPALVSEADLFLRLCPAPTVGVTGTKGKTTTASLAAAILAADPTHPVELGGNIGRPLVDLLPRLTPDHRVVIELSELQLPTLLRGTTVAVYTNVTADHLDRHGSLEAYRRVKRILADLVPADGRLVLNTDDPVVASYAEGRRERAVTYRTGVPNPGGVGIERDWIVARNVERLDIVGGGVALTGPRDRVMPLSEVVLPGPHNTSNVLAAVAVGLLFGVAPNAIRRAASAFEGVEHRLESVAIVDRVRFVNGSQGTQPDAVAAALRSFEPPIVLIAGGRDKGVDLGGLAPVVAERASAAVLIGESGPALERLFRSAGLARTERAGSLEEAVRRADALAREALSAAPPAAIGTVLLSPAAASFDMFEDYAARGRAFKAAVSTLTGERRRER